MARERWAERAVPMMGTVVTIKAFGRSPEVAIDAAFRRMAEVASLFNLYDPRSDVSRINSHAGRGWVEVSEHVARVVRRALRFSRLSRGAFDVTAAPLVLLWKRAIKHTKIPPSMREIKAARRLVGYRWLEVHPKRPLIRLRRPGMKVDLGGGAKGYVADVGVEELRRRGIRHALINAGGDVVALDAKPGGRAWVVGVEHPRKEGKLLGVVRVRGGAVATSGDYRQFFIWRGRRFCHIVDPRTGYPASKCMSVTVLAPSGLDADILSTTIFVLGPREGLALARRLKGVEALIVSSEGRVYLTPGMKRVSELFVKGGRICGIISSMGRGGPSCHSSPLVSSLPCGVALSCRARRLYFES